MKINSEFHFGVSIDDMDPISRAVYDGLCDGVSKKVLANKYKMPITTINAISKRFRTGQKEVTITPAIQVYDCSTERNINNTEDKQMKNETKSLQENQNEENKISGSGSYDSMDAKSAIKHRRKRLSSDEIETIIELLVDDSNTTHDVADAAGVSYSTVNRIRTKYIDEINKRKSSRSKTVEIAPDKVVETTAINTNNDDLKPVSVNSTVRVGLVAERHQMPVDDFIFKNKISNNLMFDYPKLERICREFIEDSIKFDENGVAQQTLVVYVTGIQCALSSLIKVTNEMKVNLILRHYNSDTNTYFRNVIWNQFGPIELPEEIEELFANSSNSYVYNCTVDELYNNKSLVRISKVYYKDSAYKNIDHIDIILTKDVDDAFYIMKKHINQANKEKQKVIIFTKEYKLGKNKFYENGFEIKLQTK